MATRAAMAPPWADGGGTGATGAGGRLVGAGAAGAGDGTSGTGATGTGAAGGVCVGADTVSGLVWQSADPAPATSASEDTANTERSLWKITAIYSAFSRRFFIRLSRASNDSFVMILLNSAR
jgi:hypothetical protein